MNHLATPEFSAALALEEGWLDDITVLSNKIGYVGDVAEHLQVPLGSIVTESVCNIDGMTALVLMAGDMGCDPLQVARILNKPHAPVELLSHAELVELAGDPVQAMFPIALSTFMPTLMDASLKRFDVLYTRAGSRTCFMETTYSTLKTVTKATVSYALAPPDWRLARRS